ncbi:hypothetical protein HMF8227_00805 [Saliniradius amylolyticus]|uniref:DUF2802 domain-containing protein n=1 Tax=Saliniradius amylolyticus TaxID=2183582 RepID=A0A2S2E0Y4_9ALTE|nr:DUF2802 domain-containing protein [Saliniradius amylolyticus]AWL11301.1 hypothetical protein HMF8227_00805 [Saliniradius amylolyticus]
MELQWFIGTVGAVLVLLLLLLAWQIRRSGRLHEQLRSISEKQHQQAKRLTEVDAQLHELRTGSIGVGDRVKQLTVQLEELKQQQRELAEMEPESKLYSKAVKLFQNGAGIEEVMQECELPRAEAELLFNLHGKAS